MPRCARRFAYPVRCAVAVVLCVALAGCGGAASGPDAASAQQKILDHVNFVAEGKAAISRFAETGRQVEEFDGIEGCTISFEGELEFTGDCEYDMKPRQQGDRVAFEATIEYLKEEAGWKQLTMGIYPR